MTPESIASICHEAVRRYCRETGDNTQKVWEDAPYRQKQSAIAGVMFVIQHPDASPSAAHENWLEQRTGNGWEYGPVKSEALRQHPCILPYDKLPEDQRTKDKLFQAVVKSLIKGDTDV